MDKKNLAKNIDEIFLKNVDYIPEKERKIIVDKIIQNIIDSINWIQLIKTFRCIIANNKGSSLCQSVFCVSYMKKFMKNEE